MHKFLLVGVFAFSFLPLIAQNTITGRIADHPNREVIFYLYEDHLSKKKSIAGKAVTDKKGDFSLTIPYTYRQLQLAAGNKALSFFVLRDGEYHIAASNGRLAVTDAKGAAVNRDLHEINTFLTHHWYPLFINLKTGEFNSKAHPDTVLHVVNSYYEELRGRLTDSILADWVWYRMGTVKCQYLQMLEESVGKEQAKIRMNQFEQVYFDNRPVPYNNPFYFEALNVYLDARFHLIVFHRAELPDTAGYWQRIVGESRFLNDRLRPLAVLHGIKGIFENRFHEQDGEALILPMQQFRDSLAGDAERKIYANLFAVHTTLKKGDAFPIIALANEKNKPASIANVNADVILVDFWGTWCTPCVEHMQHFPSLLRKYGKKLQIVSISVDDSLQTMQRFLNEKKYTGKWLTLHNGSSGNYYNKLTLSGYPSYFILDRNRKLLAMPFFNDMEQTLEKIMTSTGR